MRIRLMLALIGVLILFNTIPAVAQGGETLLDQLTALMNAGWSFEQVDDTVWEFTDGQQTITITLSEPLPTLDEEIPAEEPVDLLPVGDRFNVVPTSNVNLRECASTTCAQVGTATTSTVIEVLAVEEDEQQREWYRFETEDGNVAYIAGWLTRRGPDVRLSQSEIEDGYFDANTECGLALQLNRGRNSMAFAITGDAYYDVYVDLYRPSETRPLNVFGQYPKTFIDTGEPYIHQVYNASFPAGTYTIELTGANGNTSVIEFVYENTGDSIIFVFCD